MTKAEELKARLRRFSIRAADFSDNKKQKVEQVEYIRLDMALSAIDELVEKQEWGHMAKGCNHVVVTNTGGKPSYCAKCGQTFGTNTDTPNPNF